VTFVGGLVALLLALVAQATLGRWFPHAQRYVDVLTWPVAWYAVARGQRSAMLVGCGAGLLEDAWFHAGIYGLHGFSKTLAGWALGGLGARFDLNHVWGRSLVGAALFLMDRLLEAGLLLLLNLSIVPLAPAELALGAGINGLLVAVVFSIVQKVRGRDAVRRPGRRRS
jgi:rod shape-determining protein MreD